MNGRYSYEYRIVLLCTVSKGLMYELVVLISAGTSTRTQSVVPIPVCRACQTDVLVTRTLSSDTAQCTIGPLIGPTFGVRTWDGTVNVTGGLYE
eukprot:scaffold106369_cov18-Prasinocladus_malaysianus.AAC.1